MSAQTISIFNPVILIYTLHSSTFSKKNSKWCWLLCSSKYTTSIFTRISDTWGQCIWMPMSMHLELIAVLGSCVFFLSWWKASRSRGADYLKNLKSFVALKQRFLSSGVRFYLHSGYLCASWSRIRGVEHLSDSSVPAGECFCISISPQQLSLRSSSCFGCALPRLHLSALVC